MEPPFRTKERITGALYAVPIILLIIFIVELYLFYTEPFLNW